MRVLLLPRGWIEIKERDPTTFSRRAIQTFVANVPIIDDVGQEADPETGKVVQLRLSTYLTVLLSINWSNKKSTRFLKRKETNKK